MSYVKSFWIGWGSLCIAGGSAYFFAKKEINADRAARFEAEQKKRRLQESYEYPGPKSNSKKGAPPTDDHSGSPSQESSAADPAPTRHAPASEGQQVGEKSKYETSEPFRARKGDRFS
ncbi:hypothetical protein BJ878DRAFT_575460 [Calycina marina]|uniref:Uncharacterized protein n=1 Tax=Calycina marina TaxID=1763456 RepID=A0A9P7Z4G9_9HELO|nr:hypothetical protein BJ878DRAFT_575460 [Calycina marina]